MQASACMKFKSRETNLSFEKLVTNLTKAGSFDQDTAQHDQQPNSVAPQDPGFNSQSKPESGKKELLGGWNIVVLSLDVKQTEVFTGQRYLLLMHCSGCLSFIKVHVQVINPFIHFTGDQQNFMSILGIQRKNQHARKSVTIPLCESILKHQTSFLEVAQV